MLDLIKQNYGHHHRAQFIMADLKGRILQSDNTVFHVGPFANVVDIHPFFECHGYITQPETVFDCVNLVIQGLAYTFDVKVLAQNKHLIFVLHDFTEHYFKYQKIAQAKNESIIDSELVILKNLELEERERFKNAFIQNFSHELRNPLTSIMAITKILGETALTAEQRKMLAFLDDANTNLRSMLEDILSISMIAEGRLKLDHKVFNFKQLLEMLEFSYKAKAKEKGLSFGLTSDPKIPEFLEGDRLRVYQVLTNLLENAVKFTQNGKVGLQVQFNQKRANKIGLRFLVSDTGIGISKEEQALIFESFSRLQSAQGQQGSGLGLSIAQGLVALMGGKLKVESTLGGGSIFYFDLVLNFPLQLASKPFAVNLNTKEVKVRPALKGRKFKLLLVEDDLTVGLALFKLLMDTKLFYIDSVNDGALVMAELMNTTYDLILMDINLPNVSGDQLTRLIRAFPFKNIKQIPIVGITANAYEEDTKLYLASGMNAVITKPFEEQKLLETVYGVLK